LRNKDDILNIVRGAVNTWNAVYF